MAEDAGNLQHPVPQNVISVEFKLFGSFSMRQFSKMLIGCLVAVGLFVMPLPFYIKFPLMILSVILGVGTAIVPQLATWVSGYVKALFISPRYVWIKASRPPESLLSMPTASVGGGQKVASSQNSSKVDLSEISLDKLLSSVSTSAKQTKNNSSKEDVNELAGKSQQGVARASNLDRLMGNTFANDMVSATNAKKQQQIQVQNQVSQTKVLATQEDFEREISTLKEKLNNLHKRKYSPEEEQQLIQRINMLYQQFQLTQQRVQPQESLPKADASIPAKQVVDAQGTRIGEGQVVFGIVVNQNNQPIKGVSIIFRELSTGDSINAITTDDGRFTSSEKLFLGEYDVTLQHPEYRFHTYKIKVGDAVLPAYKFRTK